MVGMVDSEHVVFVGRKPEKIGEPTETTEVERMEWVPLADVAPAENLIHPGGSRCMGEADVVRDGGRWGTRATGNAVAW